MILEAKVMTITKAGIHAVVEDDEGTLQSRFSWRETTTKATSSSTTSPRERRSPSVVIGSRFELNDQYICVIATLERDTPTEL
jgi:hypothetical protein